MDVPLRKAQGICPRGYGLNTSRYAPFSRLLTWHCPCPSSDQRGNRGPERGLHSCLRSGRGSIQVGLFAPPKLTPFSATHRLREPQ